MRTLVPLVILTALLAGCGSDASSPAAPSTPNPAPPAVVTPPTPPGAPPGPNQTPALFAKISPDPATGPVGLTVHLNACLSSDPEGDLLAYSFEYGDGKKDAGFCRSHHAYAKERRYTASVCVTDNQTGHAPVCRSFPVSIG